MNDKTILVVAAATLLYASVPAMGQTAAGLSRDQLDQTLNPVPRRSESPKAGAVATDNAQTPLPPAGGAGFDLARIEFTGSSVYDAADLAPLWDEYAGQKITLRELAIVANRVQVRYRADGYLAARAILEPQDVVGGVVTLTIHEGRLSQVLLPEGAGARGEAIRRRIVATFVEGEPLTSAAVERALLLARDVPGIDLRATLEPASNGDLGGIDLRLSMVDQPIAGFANIQNIGSESTGPWLSSAGVDLNGVLSELDHIRAILLVEPFESEQLTGLLSYGTPIGASGLMLRGDVSFSHGEPGDTLEPLDLTADTFTASLEVEYPLVRSLDFSLFAIAGLDYSHQVTETPSVRLFEDRIGSVYGAMRLRATTSPAELTGGLMTAGLLNSTLRVRQGIDGIGSSVGSASLSRFGGRPDYTLARLDLDYTQPFRDGLVELAFSGRAQYATSPLLAFEEMSVGGIGFGRGYDPASLSGDSGVAGSVELRLRPPFFAAGFLRQTEFYAFAEGGQVWNRNESPQTEDLLSVGVGVRLRFDDPLADSAVQGVLDLTWARPLEPALSSQATTPDDRYLVNFSLLF